MSDIQVNTLDPATKVDIALVSKGIIRCPWCFGLGRRLRLRWPFVVRCYDCNGKGRILFSKEIRVVTGSKQSTYRTCG